MIVRDTSRRLTIDGVLAHPWLANVSTLDKHNLTDNLHEMRLFNAKRKLRAALRAMMAGENLKAIFGDHQKA